MKIIATIITSYGLTINKRFFLIITCLLRYYINRTIIFYYSVIVSSRFPLGLVGCCVVAVALFIFPLQSTPSPWPRIDCCLLPTIRSAVTKPRKTLFGYRWQWWLRWRRHGGRLAQPSMPNTFVEHEGVAVARRCSHKTDEAWGMRWRKGRKTITVEGPNTNVLWGWAAHTYVGWRRPWLFYLKIPKRFYIFFLKF